MISDATSASTSFSEPIELRLLKQQLANVHCIKWNRNSKVHPSPTVHRNLERYSRHARVQTESNFPSDVNILHTRRCCDTKSFCKDVFCSSCLFSMNLPRKDIVKVLKDEECGTDAIYKCDKVAGRRIKSLEKKTSTKSMAKLSESVCDSTSNDSLSTSPESPDHKAGAVLKVTFNESNISTAPEPDRNELMKQYHRRCMEDFINSIRPPMTYSMKRYIA